MSSKTIIFSVFYLISILSINIYIYLGYYYVLFIFILLLIIDIYFIQNEKNYNLIIYPFFSKNYNIIFLSKQIFLLSFILQSNVNIYTHLIYIFQILLIQFYILLTGFYKKEINKKGIPIPVKNFYIFNDYRYIIKILRQRENNYFNTIYLCEFITYIALILEIYSPYGFVNYILTLEIIIIFAILLINFILFHESFKKIKNGYFINSIINDINDYSPQVVLYFSGEKNSVYQVNTWLKILEEIDNKAIVYLREYSYIDSIEATKLKVLIIPKLIDLEMCLLPSIKIILYPANVGKNLHLLRNPNLKHIFIGHGDSDKIASQNNFVKVYDKIFVAGEAAIDRYKKAGIKISNNAFVIVGRPQIDIITNKSNSKTKTILYAPTWEGYFNDSDYSSILSMAKLMIKKILEIDKKTTIIFKPHPLTGLVNSQLVQTINEINDMFSNSERYFYEDKNNNNLYELINKSDLLITDISSLISDYLNRDRPIILTNVNKLEHNDLSNKFPVSRACYILEKNLSNLNIILSDAFNKDSIKNKRNEIKKHILGDFQGSALKKFNYEINNIYNQS